MRVRFNPRGLEIQRLPFTNKGCRSYSPMQQMEAFEAAKPFTWLLEIWFVQAATRDMEKIRILTGLKPANALKEKTTGLFWSVPTGRKDGNVSLASETSNLPAFTNSVNVQKQKFAAKGLDTIDLVTLVGGHIIGTSACQFFRYRLYNFNNTNGPDPSIDTTFLAQLRCLCPENGNEAVRVGLDYGSTKISDASFFINLKNRRGVLESDQMQWDDDSTRDYIQRFTSLTINSRSLKFDVEFANSMARLGNVGDKTGSYGEIRTNCSSII